MEKLPDHLNESARGIISLKDNLAKSPTFFLTGNAGSGKTYMLMKHIADDSYFGLLCATTGIASVNLGEDVATLHSQFKCFDVSDFKDSFIHGQLHRRLRVIRAEGYRWLIIDEVSMLHKDIVDYLVKALDEINSDEQFLDYAPLGLMLVGDFAQLPPIGSDLIENGRPVLAKSGKPKQEKTPWAFDSEAWKAGRFSNSLRLQTNWRQQDKQFIEGLSLIRLGAGLSARDGVTSIKSAGVNFTSYLNQAFDGVTIFASNKEVDGFNTVRLMETKGDYIHLESHRWTSVSYTPGEFSNIPPILKLKLNALIMILSNDHEAQKLELPMRYANGDLGYLREVTKDGLMIELQRNNELVVIPRVTRRHLVHEQPETKPRALPLSNIDYLDLEWGTIRRDNRRGQRWIAAEINYYPVRLAYASTCHKTQGLTVDRVQLDPRNRMFKQPGMAYVALSRARTPEGLIIVQAPGVLIDAIRAEPRLKAMGFL